jgi:hypothetical protein
MAELTEALGLRWAEPIDGENAGRRYRIAFSADPPHLELLEVPPGSPWEVPGGRGLHHFRWWSDAYGDDVNRLLGMGGQIMLGGIDAGWIYIRLAETGMITELIDRNRLCGVHSGMLAASAEAP